MKRHFIYFLTFAIVGFGTVSCGNDDNKPIEPPVNQEIPQEEEPIPDPEPDHLIVGSWEYSKFGDIIAGQEILIDWQYPYPECTKDFWEFTNNEKMYSHEFDSYEDVVCEEDVEMVIYNISDNILTIKDSQGEEEPIEFTIMILNDTTLKLSLVGINDFGNESTDIIVLTRKSS